MITRAHLYFLLLSEFLVSRYICQLQHSCSLLWRLSWLSLAWATAILSITSDQFYLAGWIQRDLHKIEIAAKLFPLNRSIALGPAQFYVIKDEPSEKALRYIAVGLNYDPNAIDLLQANFKYKYMMGKNEEALNAYQKLKKIAPDNEIVKLFTEVK